jgi:hypothetical protein
MSGSRQKQFDGLFVHDFQRKNPEAEQRREPRISTHRAVSILPCDGPFLVKARLQRILLAVYTVQFCQAIDQAFRIGAELSGFIGGMNDDSPQVLETLLTDVDSAKPSAGAF